MGTSFTLDYLSIIIVTTYKGFAYARQSSLTRERTNSNTFINWSMVSQVTCFSLPSLEYRYTVRLRGSTTQRDRVSSSIGLSVDYSGIIARQGGSCQPQLLRSFIMEEFKAILELKLPDTLFKDQSVNCEVFFNPLIVFAPLR